MKKLFKPRITALMVSLTLAALCFAYTGIPNVVARDDDDDDERVPSLPGTWRVTVNPGSPNQFFSLMEFNKVGTMTEASSTPGKTMSSGVWKKIRGHGNFAATFEVFQDGDSDGFFDTRLRVRLTIHLMDDDTITGTSTVDVLTLDGTTQVAGPFPGIPLEGTRMRVMREGEASREPQLNHPKQSRQYRQHYRLSRLRLNSRLSG